MHRRPSGISLLIKVLELIGKHNVPLTRLVMHSPDGRSYVSVCLGPVRSRTQQKRNGSKMGRMGFLYFCTPLTNQEYKLEMN